MQIDLTKTQTIQAITIYAFLLVIFLVMIRYLLFAKDIENKGVAKIIGGLAVFIVALISQNAAVIGISLFIGGLIIASEEFMQKLAIIMRSESKDIGENLKPLTPTQQEVKEKKQQEIHETKEIQEGLVQSQIIKPLASKQNTSAYLLKSTIHGEKAIVEYLMRKLKDRFTEDIKFENVSGRKSLVDGVIFDEKNEPKWIVEIRVLKVFETATAVLARTVDKVRSAIPDLPLVICFVFLDGISAQEVKILKEFAKNFSEIKIAIFSLKNDHLSPILDINL